MEELKRILGYFISAINKNSAIMKDKENDNHLHFYRRFHSKFEMTPRGGI